MQQPVQQPISKARKQTHPRNKNTAWSYLFVLPAFVLIALFLAYPLIASYPYALYNWDGLGNNARFVGLQNFERILQDPYFWAALKHTFTYALLLVPLQLCIALILALILNNPKLTGVGLYRTLIFLPSVTSTAIVGIIIAFMFSMAGEPLSRMLQQLNLIPTGTQLNILSDPRFALIAITIVGIWQYIGSNMIRFLAALQSISKDVYEAAAIDGANSFQTFWLITIPMLKGPAMVITALAFTGSLQVFDLVVVMGGTGASSLLSGTEVVTTYIYRNAFGEGNNVGFASAAAIIMGLITVAVTLLLLGITRMTERKSQ